MQRESSPRFLISIPEGKTTLVLAMVAELWQAVQVMPGLPGGGDSRIHFARFGAVGTDEVLVAGGAVALGAVRRDLGWVIPIPMGEGFRVYGSMG
ncbi:MAG TPA: hypothetical protein VIV15_14755, partial [Anaerolineales bacterium]